MWVLLFVFLLVSNGYLVYLLQKQDKFKFDQSVNKDTISQVKKTDQKFYLNLKHIPFSMKKMLMCQMITSHWAASDLRKDTLTMTTADATNINFSLVFSEDGNTVSRAANPGEPILSGDHIIIQQDENTLVAFRKSILSEVKPRQSNYEYILLSKTTGIGIIYTGNIYNDAHDNIMDDKIANYFHCD